MPFVRLVIREHGEIKEIREFKSNRLKSVILGILQNNPGIKIEVSQAEILKTPIVIEGGTK